MRLKVILESKNKKIPRGNRFMIISLIKKAIELEDKDLFNELYFFEGKKNKKIKPFTFAIYLNDFNVKEEYIELNGDISITISTSDYNLGIAIYNGLLKLDEFKFDDYKYKDYELIIKRINLIKEKKVNENVILCKTLSPIHIKDKNNKPIQVNNIDFENELNYISNIFLQSYRGFGLKQNLKFTPIKMKKQVIKEEIRGFAQLTNKKYIFIDSYSGIFSLEGDSEDLKLLLQNGIGFRRSEGLGCIDLI